MTKYGFYVSKNATRFIKALQSDILNEDNCAFVLADFLSTTKLAEACGKYNIPLYQYSYKANGLFGKDRNIAISNYLLKLLRKYNCEYSFLLGGRLLLYGDILNEFDKRIINFHPSLLPAYKGELKAIDAALSDGVLLLGNTAHFVNEKADDGLMIMQSIITAKEFSDYDSVLDMQLPMLKQIISWLEQNRFVFDSEGKFSIEGAKYEMNSFVPNLEGHIRECF